MKRFVSAALAAVLVLTYPLLVYFGVQRLGHRVIGSLVAVALFVRLLHAKHRQADLLLLAPLGGALVLVVGLDVVAGSGLGTLLLPAIINFTVMSVFALSLVRPPCVVERIVRMIHDELAPHEVGYTRSVTKLWSVFLGLNGCIALSTAFAGHKVWALYNGVLTYLLMITLFAGETLYRYWRFRRYIGAPGERFLKRLFPPRDE